MTDLELDSLDQKVRDLGIQVELDNIKTKIHYNQCERKIVELTNTLNSIQDDSQEEIDLLTQENTNHSNQIKAIEDADYDTQIDELSGKVDAAKESLNAMDAEHHQLMEELSNKVSVQTDKIEETKAMLDGIIRHQVISEEDYRALGTPDDDVLYFTYEE